MATPETASETTTETAEEQPDATLEQAETKKAKQDAAEAKREARAARKEAAQAKKETEEAEEAMAEAEAALEKRPSSKSKKRGDTETVTIRVTGTSGISFSGSYGNIDSQRSVDGMTPADFEQEVDTGFLSFDPVSAVMQKMGEGGELRVQIIVDGDVEKEESTTAQYGVVSLLYSPGE